MASFNSVMVSVAAVALSAFIALSFGQKKYAEVSCEINDKSDYAVIWIDESALAQKKRPLKYNVQFDPAGVVFRLPSEFYAPEWPQIENLTMHYADSKADSGILQIQEHNVGGKSRLQMVGTVKRLCWNSVKRYIDTHVRSKGVAVHMSEIVESH